MNNISLVALFFFTGIVLNAQIAVLPSFQASHYKPPPFPNNLVTSGLILNLDASNSSSYPGTGTTWYDLSGQGANSTLTNGTAWVSNGSSSYFNFDGVDDLAVGINIPQSYKDLMMVIWSGGVTGVDQSEMIFVTGTASDFSFRTTAGNFRHMDPYPPNAQDWNGSMTDRDFVNGTFTSSNPSLIGAWNIVRVCRNSSYSFSYCLSTNFIINPACSYRGYKGKIAIVLCYNRELTQAEVLQNYNFLKSRFGL